MVLEKRPFHLARKQFLRINI